MEYIKHIEDGYILSVQNNAPVGTGNCTQEEYNTILRLVNTAPVPLDGYEYKLTEGLEWVLCELPRLEYEETTESVQSEGVAVT